MPKGIYDNSKRRKSKSKLKSRVICKKCCSVFYPDISIKKNQRECPGCKKIIDIRDRSGYLNQYKKKYPNKAKERFEKMQEYNKNEKERKKRGKKYRERVRKTVLNIISNNNPVCENCGCNDIRLLEINHKNGGGRQEFLERTPNQFMQDIYSGKRETGDLNLLCRVCNAEHYLELKFGKLNYKVIWEF